MNNIKLHLILAFIICSGTLKAQVILSGIILNNKTNEPIEAANIFIAHTSSGTISKVDGSFELSIPLGYSQLVISHISFKSLTKNLTFLKPGKQIQTIRLVPIDVEIDEVIVSAKNEKKWRKNLKKFEKAFLGDTKNASKCTIINPTALNFENIDGKLIAKSTDLIEIENRSTGYKVFFYLKKFETDGQTVTYSGKPFFNNLSPIDDKEFRFWTSQRQKTYMGSPQHFYRSLVRNTVDSEGFKIFTATLQDNKGFLTTGTLQVQDLLLENEHPLEKIIRINDFIKVVYTREGDRSSLKKNNYEQSAKRLGHPAERDAIGQESSIVQDNRDFQVSYLFARKNNVPIDSSGSLLRSELLVEYGYWSYERIADLLPREFQPKQMSQKKQIKTDSFPALLSFKMNNLRIPYEEIRRGGPPKDGIPSIDHPKFLTPSEATFLHDEDYVLGVEINGIAKAYSIQILNYHEIVNDWFGDLPIVITYCPLCGSGASFSASIDGEHFTFGVSGLLYNNDVLIYDRKTESLWSQIMGEAVSGEASGTPLKLVPTNHTTWKNWKREHPDTKVLSIETGYDRDYTNTPYSKYENTDNLMFPVNQSISQNRYSKTKKR